MSQRLLSPERGSIRYEREKRLIGGSQSGNRAGNDQAASEGAKSCTVERGPEDRDWGISHREVRAEIRWHIRAKVTHR